MPMPLWVTLGEEDCFLHYSVARLAWHWYLAANSPAALCQCCASQNPSVMLHAPITTAAAQTPSSGEPVTEKSAAEDPFLAKAKAQTARVCVYVWYVVCARAVFSSIFALQMLCHCFCFVWLRDKRQSHALGALSWQWAGAPNTSLSVTWDGGKCRDGAARQWSEAAHLAAPPCICMAC